MLEKAKRIGFGLGMAALAILLYQVVIELVMTAGYYLMGPEVFAANTFMLDTIAATILTVLYALWLYALCHRKKQTEEPPRASLNRRMLLSVSVIALGLRGVSGAWFAALELGLKEIPFLGESLQSHGDTWTAAETEPYVWVFLSVVVVGPIVEELLFRGLVFHSLEKVRAGWFPIVLSGIAFGIWHGEPVQCVYTAIMGVAYGLVYAKTRDLRVTMFMHILNNFLSTLPPVLDTDLSYMIVGISDVLMLVPAVLLLVRMGKEWSRNQNCNISTLSPQKVA